MWLGDVSHEPVGDGAIPSLGKSAAEPAAPCDDWEGAGVELAAGWPVDHGALGARIVSPGSMAAEEEASAERGVEFEAVDVAAAVGVTAELDWPGVLLLADQPPCVLGTSCVLGSKPLFSALRLGRLMGLGTAIIGPGFLAGPPRTGRENRT